MGGLVQPSIMCRILRMVQTKHATSSSVGQYLDSALESSLLRNIIGSTSFLPGGRLPDASFLLWYTITPKPSFEASMSTNSCRSKSKCTAATIDLILLLISLK